MELNPQAEELNEIIKKNNKNVYEMLSDKGRAIFFPKKGILSQSAEAKGKKINATIGIALEDDGTPMRLKSIAKKIKLDPKELTDHKWLSPRKALKEADSVFIETINIFIKKPLKIARLL